MFIFGCEMRLFRSFIFLVSVVAVLAVPSLAKNVFVAVLETVTMGSSVSRAEKVFLTDKLRSQAVEVLPSYKDFVVMTRENILAFLPPDKSLEECEGGCLVQTGKNIAADYVAQARVGQFGSDLTLTVELYETASGRMLSSYTSRNSSVDELLSEIESRSAMLFGTIPGAITVNAEKDGGGHGGFTSVSMGSHWSSSRIKKRLIEVSSNPVGALLSVDGRPQSNCQSTPCNVELTEGNHKFTFVLDRYFDLDTLVNVNGYTTSLGVRMKPNFGTLVIDPKFPDRLGSADGLSVQVDNEDGSLENTLSPGWYRVELKHACYEDVLFNVNIARGQEFRFDKKLVPKNGHVSIRARQGDSPQRVPVYVNGKKAGMTPFDEDVSVCATVTVGDEQAGFPYAIQAHAETEWVYEIPEEEEENEEESYDSYEYSSSSEYTFNLSGFYSSSSRRRSESSSSYSINEVVSSSDSEGPVRFIIQGLMGFGFEALREDGVEDEEVLAFYDNMNGGCDYWDDYYDRCSGYSDTASIDGLYGYIDLFLGLEFARFLTIGAGAGIGVYTLSSMDDKNLDEDLPGANFAPNIFFEVSLGTEYTFGARYMYVFEPRWPSTRMSGFFEWLNVFGIELGGTNTEGLGTNFFISVYLRAPTRGNLKEMTKTK